MCGFFIKPNFIVLKKQNSRKREIFTLAHELGHYLLNNENIDENTFVQNPNNEESWCNQFAFALLLGESLSEIQNINTSEISLTNQTIQELSEKRHIPPKSRVFGGVLLDFGLSFCRVSSVQ